MTSDPSTDRPAPMRILHVGVGNLGPGGVATYVGGLVRAQRERGHEVVVVELWPTDTSRRLEEADPLHEIGAMLARRDQARSEIVHIHALLPSYRGLEAGTIMTSHEHAAHCPSGARYLEGRRVTCDRKFGWMACLRGHYLDQCGSRKPANLLRRFQVTRTAVEFPGHWIVPSVFGRAQILRRGIPAGKVHHVPNPVAMSAPPRLPREGVVRQFVYLGRLVPNKGCDVLLRALAMVQDARVLVLGEGSERGPLEALARELHIADRVEFGGWADAEGVATALRRSAALVVPSLWPEPFGLVALEAFREGCPVLASRVGGLAEIVDDGTTGFLVPPNEPRALADAMSRILVGGLGESMGAAGAAVLPERYGMESHVEALDGIYRLARSGG